MGRSAARTAFTASLCAGVAMVGAAADGLMDVDAELQRSVLAARQRQEPVDRAVSFRVSLRERQGGCPGSPAMAPRTRERA